MVTVPYAEPEKPWTPATGTSPPNKVSLVGTLLKSRLRTPDAKPMRVQRHIRSDAGEEIDDRIFGGRDRARTCDPLGVSPAWRVRRLAGVC